MSDHSIQLVPADACYRPTKKAADRAKSLLKSFVPQADDVRAQFMDSISFFDPLWKLVGRELSRAWRRRRIVVGRRHGIRRFKRLFQLECHRRLLWRQRLPE